MDNEKEVNENYDVDILDLIYCENKDGCRNNHPCSVCRATYKRFSEALKAERTKREEAEKKNEDLLLSILNLSHPNFKYILEENNSLRIKRDELEAKVKELQSWKDQVNLLDSRVDDLVDSPIKHKLIQKYMEVDSLESQLATANAKIVELEKENIRLKIISEKVYDALIAAILSVENELENADKNDREYFSAVQHRWSLTKQAINDYKKTEIETSGVLAFWHIKQKLSTAKRKAEKLVEALEAIKRLSNGKETIGHLAINESRINELAEQALKEFRGDV